MSPIIHLGQKEPDPWSIYGTRCGEKKGRPVSVQQFLYQIYHQNANQKRTLGRQQHRVTLFFHSPFSESASFPVSLFYLHSRKSIVLWWDSSKPGFVCQTGGAGLAAA